MKALVLERSLGRQPRLQATAVHDYVDRLLTNVMSCDRNHEQVAATESKDC